MEAIRELGGGTGAGSGNDVPRRQVFVAESCTRLKDETPAQPQLNCCKNPVGGKMSA
jgi:hypothetical protein